jgi:hypothetical protein
MGHLLPRRLQVMRNVYSVVFTKARNPLSHEDVESHLEGAFEGVRYPFGTMPMEIGASERVRSIEKCGDPTVYLRSIRRCRPRRIGIRGE